MTYNSQSQLQNLIDSIVKEQQIKISIESIEITEKLEENKTIISAAITVNEDEYSTASEGRGYVDALFSAFQYIFRNKYNTLQLISFLSFKLNSQNNDSFSSDADVEMRVLNSRTEEFVFYSKGYSINAAATEVVVQAVEFFINSELAIKFIYKAVKDAQRRRRSDLVEEYLDNMSQLVKVTDYSKIIEQLKKDLKC